MTLVELLLTNFAVITGAILLLWLVSIPIRNASIVDVFWGPAFAVVALIGWYFGDSDHDRRKLLTALTCAWGLRLGAYLALRNLRQGEDARYARWRKRIEDAGGNFTLRSLVMVFGLQGLLVIIVSLPVEAGQLAITGRPPGNDGLVRHAAMGRRIPVLSGRRLATTAVQGRSRQSRQAAGPRSNRP